MPDPSFYIAKAAECSDAAKEAETEERRAEWLQAAADWITAGRLTDEDLARWSAYSETVSHQSA